MSDRTMFCLICGGPILEPHAYASQENPWLARATLLAEDNSEKSSTNEFAATTTGGPYFQLDGSNEKITACEIHHPLIRPKPTTYLPSHSACIDITKRMISSRTSVKARQQELFHHVWEVLYTRYQKAALSTRVPVTKIYEPNGYYGAYQFQEMEWEPGTTPERRHESETYEADPITIPNLTSSMLSHLAPLPSTSTSTPSSSSPPPPPTDQKNTLIPDPAPLPPEILTNIFTQLSPFTDPPQTCTYAVAPSHWRAGLQDGTILPWLWDLDAALIANKAQLSDTKEWDWEKLTRQLALTALHEPGKVFDDLPMGLRNRRRIWRLVGDILETDTETKDADGLGVGLPF